jgi:hypothetical protein
MRFSRISVLAALAAVMFLASSASAAVVIGGSDGWSFSTDGMVNLFGVYQTADDAPALVNPSGIPNYIDDTEGFRIKSGFLPGILAFNIKAPTMAGLDMGARIGFYPEPSNANVKDTFDGQIDLREIFFTVDGSFGQVLAGKALSLFLGQNLLTEQTLMGVGRLGGALNADVGPTLGRIGYGYPYPNFNAQFRYTTPDMSGFKLAVAICDPSVILGDNAYEGGAYSTSATETDKPRIEGELSYAGTFGNGGTFKAYANGMWQEAEIKAADLEGETIDGEVISGIVGDDVTAWGFGGGVVVGMAGFEFVGSAYTGEALGSQLMFDLDAIDAAGDERESWGYILQGSYAWGKNKFGVSYGVTEIDETDADKFVRQELLATEGVQGYAQIEEQSMLTFMFTHDINTNLKLVAEMSMIEHEYHNGEDWDVEMYSLGAFFLW